MTETRPAADRDADAADVLEFGGFRFVCSSSRLYHGDFEVHLRPKAAAVLRCLLERPGEIVTKDEFFETVWHDVHVREESLTQTISAIRRRLGDLSQDPAFIETVPGKGYRFIGTLERSSPDTVEGAAPPATARAPHDRPERRDTGGAEPEAARSAGGTPAQTETPRTERESGRRPTEDEAAAEKPPWLAALPWALAIVMTLASGALLYLRLTQPSPPTRRFNAVSPAVELAPPDGGSPLFALSPTGSHLVYRAYNATGDVQLFLQQEGRLEGLPLADSAGAETPFFSPDGEWVGFVSAGRVWVAAVDGGSSPVSVGEVDSAVIGAGWGDDGLIVLGRSGAGLVSLSAQGGPVTALTELDAERREVAHQWPHVLPGGDAVVFNIVTTPSGEPEIAVLSLRSGRIDVLPLRGVRPRYVETGHLLYGREQSLAAVPFDPVRLKIDGTPVGLLDRAWVDYETGRAEFDVSRTGTLAYAPPPTVEYEMSLYARSGSEGMLARTISLFRFTTPQRPRFSPDGRFLAFEQGSALPPRGRQITVRDLSTGITRAITSGEHRDLFPSWVPPGGERLIFSSDRGSSYDLFSIPTDGSASAAVLLAGPVSQLPGSVSANGDVLLFQQSSPETGWDIVALALDGKSGTAVLVDNPGTDAGPVFSPNGRCFAYVSDVSGRAEVYVRSYPDPSAWTVQISTDGGHGPLWSPAGDEIYFVQGDHLMAAPVSLTDRLESDPPRVLHEGPFRTGAPHLPRSYDVSPDGRTFVLARTLKTVPTSINIALSWFAELETLAPPER